MRRHAVIAVAVAALAWFAALSHAEAPPDRGADRIQELLDEARGAWDLSALDAVVLLSSEEITLRPEGVRETAVHTIVWLASELAVNEYADVRVPWNEGASTLEVETLRTWRDGRWWPDESAISETAVVQTLPSALATADDYTTMRETVLLHDGVEIPCVVETAYRVTERRPAGLGDDGVWIFAKDDPAVVSSLSILNLRDSALRSATGNIGPGTTAEEGGAGGARVWTMKLVDRLPRPLVADAVTDAPYVAWSTWGSWDALGDAVLAAFAAPGTLSAALAESLSARTGRAAVPWLAATSIAEFLGESTRFVRYDDRFWALEPRPASRTWETAYAHRLDRAALAAALFRAAGFEATPFFRTAAGVEPNVDVPGLALLGGVLLSVGGAGVQGWYDPAGSTLHAGTGARAGTMVWGAGSGGPPGEESPGPAGEGVLEVVATLAAEGDSFSGNAVVTASGPASPYEQASGVSGELAAYTRRMAASLLPGARASDAGALTLEPGEFVGGFSLALDPGDADDEGRTEIDVGEPEGGILSRLPADVALYESERESPVILPGPFSQRVTLRLDPGEREVVRLPEPVDIENGVGRFAVTVENDEETTTVTREIALRSRRIAPADWPLLRTLLLAETDRRSRAVLLR